MSDEDLRVVALASTMLVSAVRADEPVQLQKVEITGAAVDLRRDATVARLVVGREEIARHGDSNLAAVLRRVSGVSVERTGSKDFEVRLNGLGSGYTQMLLNGDPVPQGFDIASLAPDLVERIEVSRSALVDSSTQAVAGTINIVLRKAPRGSSPGEWKLALGEQRGRPTFLASLQGSGQQGNTRYALTGTVERALGRDSAQLQDTGTDTQGVTTLLRQGQREGREGRSTASLAPHAEWTLGDDTVTTDGLLRWGHYRSSFEERIATDQGEPPEHSLGLLDYRSRSSFARAKVAWKHGLDGGATLQTRLTATLGRRVSDAFYQGYDEIGTLRQDQNVHAGANDSSLLASGKYVSRHVEGHALALGWDAESHRRQERRVQTEVPLPGSTPKDLDELNTSRTRRLAMFAQDEWDINSNTSLYLGLRWEGLQTRTSPAGRSAVDRRFSVWSPVVQGVWRPTGTAGAQLRLALSRTYKAPTPLELIPRRYVAVNNSPANPDTEGNPALANSVDLAWELNIGHVGFVGVNVIWRRIDDVVVEQLMQENGTWILRRSNQGRAEVGGLGFEGRMKLREVWPEVPQVELRGNLAINRSSVQAVPGPDNRLDRQSPWTASVGGDWRADKLPLALGLDFSAKGGGTVRLSAERWLQRRSERTLDLFSTWQINPGGLLRLTVSNAAPVDSQERKVFADVGGSFSQTVITRSASTIKLALLMARNKCWTNFPARLIFSNGSTKPDQANTVSAGID